jgi:hypothetical protein
VPLTPANLTAAIASSLPAAGFVGPYAPQLAAGIAAGVMAWNGLVVVTTTDVGSLGAGTGLLPCLVPQPLLLAGIQTGMSSFGNIGTFAASLALGIANGLATAYASAMISTVHPGVGVGTGIAKFLSPSAVASLAGGMGSAGLIGTWAANVGSAVGVGLDTAFAAFTVTIPIIGPPSPSAGSGTGFGFVA